MRKTTSMSQDCSEYQMCFEKSIDNFHPNKLKKKKCTIQLCKCKGDIFTRSELEGLGKCIVATKCQRKLPLPGSGEKSSSTFLPTEFRGRDGNGAAKMWHILFRPISGLFPSYWRQRSPLGTALWASRMSPWRQLKPLKARTDLQLTVWVRGTFPDAELIAKSMVLQLFGNIWWPLSLFFPHFPVYWDKHIKTESLML